MEILEAIGRFFEYAEKLPKGMLGLLMGGCIALIWIGQSLRRDKQESKLIEQLRSVAQDAIDNLKKERERADAINQRLLEMIESSSRNQAMLEHANANLALELACKNQLLEKIAQLETTVEQLVTEVHNKDRSISELVRLNRQLLSTLPHEPPRIGYDGDD